MSDIIEMDVKVNQRRLLDKVENREFGLFLIHEWKRLINPFTPFRVGVLRDNVSYKPFEVTYNAPYSHYMYGGILYVDPLFNAGGFTNNGGETFFSRKGVKKVPSDRGFDYRKEKNKQATHHWDKAAEQAGQKEKLIRAANRYLERLG